MRQALETPLFYRQQIQQAKTTTIPAPVKGWNTVDPLPQMDPLYAVMLDNWIPQPSLLQVRGGQTDWATGFPGAVNSLLPYVSGAVNKLFAASGSGIYDATANGAIGSAAQAISQSKDWISTHFGGVTGTTYLVACNGTDPVLEFDGAAWTAPAITGVSPNDLSYVNVYAERLWFVEKGTQNAWYLGSLAITGAATVFPVGVEFKKGGSLVAIGNWSVDAGNGPLTYICFVTDQGEVAVYQGTDPSTAATFALVGVYVIPKPIGKNCLLQYAGDLLILTQQGVYPASKALQNATIDRASAVTYQISPTFQSVFALYGSLYGWSMTLFTEQNLLLVNIPGAGPNGAPDQYVMNTLTGAWARFRGINANAICDFNGNLFFAGKNASGANIVGQMLSGTADFGANIASNLLTAYNYVDNPIANKLVAMIQPVVLVAAPVSMLMAISMDFDPSPLYEFADIGTPSGVSLWDSSLWDSAVWSLSEFIPKQWRTITAFPGYAIAIGLQTNNKSAIIQLTSFNLLYNLGAVL